MIGGNMKQLFQLGLGIFIILCFQYTALGQSTFKVGVVDIQRLQNQSKAIQRARAKLKKKFDALQQRVADEKEAVRKLEEDFRKQSVMLSLDAKQDKKRELDRKKRYYKYIYEDFVQEMKEVEREETKKVFKDLEKVVDNIARKQNFDLILEAKSMGLIYYDDAIDITDRVTKDYDKMKQ